MTRWLITGATGLLGANAMVRFERDGEVVGMARSRPRSAPLARFIEADLADPRSLEGLVERAAPDAVLHAGAISSIEGCAEDPDLARVVNVDASAELARQAASADVPFVFISTDAVFDGDRGNYTERDATSPTSEYGRTKVDAEQAVLDAHPGAIVARVNFYGWSPSGTRSLAEFFYRNLREGTAVRGFTDIVVSTMYVGHLVEAIRDAVAAGGNGILHLASSEPITKFDFGRRVAEAMGLDPELISPALSSDVLQHARGSNLSLDTSLATRLLGRSLQDQSSGIGALRLDHDNGVRSNVADYAH